MSLHRQQQVDHPITTPHLDRNLVTLTVLLHQVPVQSAFRQTVLHARHLHPHVILLKPGLSGRSVRATHAEPLHPQDHSLRARSALKPFSMSLQAQLLSAFILALSPAPHVHGP